MIKRFFILVMLCFICMSTYASERFLITFELLQNNKKIETGNTIVTNKQNKWQKGYSRSYLKLACHQLKPGEYEKRITTIDYFSGLQVTHQIVDQNIVITVVRNEIKSRLAEIRALEKNECNPLDPVFNKSSETYNISAQQGNQESLPFGDSMIFKIKVQSIRKLK